MPDYRALYPEDTFVQIASPADLQHFRLTWKYHHKLDLDQLSYAGRIAQVEKVTYYHGGDVLYTLRGIPGIWHEHCLCPIAVAGDRPES
jgi:hypothetical protein